MVRNEPMLISASFFWSDAINAFLFGHGPMTPTLLDVMILTGLNIYASNRSFSFLEKDSFKIETRSIGDGKDMSAEICRPAQYRSENILFFSTCDLKNSSFVANLLAQQTTPSRWPKL